MESLKNLVELVPEDIRLLAGHALSAGVYAAFYVFIQTYLTEWELAVAATAAFRAFLMMVLEKLPVPQDTKAKNGKPRSRFLA